MFTFAPVSKVSQACDGKGSRLTDSPFSIGRKGLVAGTLHQSEKLIVGVTGHCSDLVGTKVDAADIARRFRADGTIDVSALRGHFVIAIADGLRGRLVLARDHLGIAPLYVCHLADGLLFSSEYKDFMPHLGQAGLLDYPVIERYLREGWTPAARTFFRSIRPIAPGVLNVFDLHQSLTIEEGQTVLEAEPKVFFEIGDVERTLDTAVRRHVGTGSQRHGLMLSGGVDSALIAFLLKRALGGGPLHSHTVGYGKDDPEVIGARRTAAALGLDHMELFVDPEELTDLLPASILATENIGGFDEYPCLYAMHQNAKERVDVMFSGNFSDAIFGGMRMHREVWEASRGNGVAPHLKPRVFAAEPLFRAGLVAADCQALPEQQPPQNLSEALTRFVLDRDERMSMQSMFAHHFGMHARMPYADFDVVSLGLRMPEEQKIDAHQNKILLREFAARCLPAEIAGRPKAIQQLKYDDRMRQWLLSRITKFRKANAYSFEQILSEDYIDLVSGALKNDLSDEVVHAAWNIVAFAYWCEAFA
ncbi:asparagine synthetase B family protein [Rhizobium terrae]|uniref:asparagine synthetase B family protein n=1 Tax=Rhizobium terrae TaxID=2171756 RepID=UPI0013C313B3|nr:asparagine synthase-related protein [Rhizobium terrae]